MVAQERGGHASLSAGVFAILILWRARLSGRDVRVRAGRRAGRQAGRPNLGHVFPLTAVATVHAEVCFLHYFLHLSFILI